MLSRFTKAAFYQVVGPMMWANGILYRALRAPKGGGHKVHLGPGQNNYIPGWVNVDANMFTGKCDVWADLRNALPFDDNSIDAIYSHHMVEHLPNMDFHFAEVYRCLRPGGIYRVAGPNGDTAIQKFVEGDKDWFGDWPDKRSSIGGRLNNFILCRNEHLTILTESYLRELMEAAGFRDLVRCVPTRDTSRQDLFSDCLKYEYEKDFSAPRTLVLEGVK
jgi:predicted SAM-dependent methyltransferase